MRVMDGFVQRVDGERFKVRRFAQLTRTAGIAQENWPVLFRAGR